jgi:serine/threonine-protein kinase
VTTIGKYRVIERLGSGAQAVVYRAVHPGLPGRDVVVKWAGQPLPADRQRLFLAEGKVLTQLDDPGLVRVHDMDVHDGRPFVVFEYVAGRTLHDQLKQGRPPFRQAALLIAQLAHVLGRVHQRGVLHRDLTPQSILIDAAGQPRLLDFGLAWMPPPSASEPHWIDRGVSGNPQYMPPEQARGEADRIGPASDVFALGAVLYELLTGQPPYQDPQRAVLWERARRGQVPPPRTVNAGIPKALEAICLKALAADPAGRYANAQQFERALRRYLLRPRLVVITALLAAVIGLGALAAFLSLH